MIDLALGDTGEYIPLRDISSRRDVSVKYLEQIIPALSRAGLILSTRGKEGGYKLSKPARAITVGEILRAAEGSFVIETEDESGGAKYFWGELSDKLNSFINKTTLADIVDEEHRGVLDFNI
jgi:Rrf2 family protein